MELKINKIKDRFNKWAYNLWDKIGIKNNWYNKRIGIIKENARLNTPKKRLTIDHSLFHDTKLKNTIIPTESIHHFLMRMRFEVQCSNLIIYRFPRWTGSSGT